MRKLIIGLAAGALLVSSAALAVKSGDTLYVKTKDAKLLDKPDAKGKTIGTMKPGDTVTWKEADKNKPFHKIEAAGKSGFTVQQNLTPNQPASEYKTSDGKPIDQVAFASSGAATKALSEAGLKYAEEETSTTVDLRVLTQGILSAEAVSQSVDLSAAQDFVQHQTGGAK